MRNILRNLKYRFDANESVRKVKRYFDGNISYRRLFIILFCSALILLYLGPALFRWLFSNPEPEKDPLMRCIDDRLTPFYIKSIEFNANIKHYPSDSKHSLDHNYIPYIGNGLFGLEIQEDAHINIKYGRVLSLPVYFHPIVSISNKNADNRGATVVDYLAGIVHRFQCFEEGYFVAYDYYAHRNIPMVFVQEIKITNTKNQLMDVDLTLPRISDWPTAVTQVLKLQHGSTILEYQVVTGLIELNNRKNEVVAVSIVSRKIPRTITLKKRGATKLEFLLTINYSYPISRDDYAHKKDEVEHSAIEAMKKALQEAEHANDEDNKLYNFRKQHIQVWQSLWSTGFEISSSLAEDSVNGDRINATIYAVLSQVRTYEYEATVTPQIKSDIAKTLTYVEGCYDSYHTLQAANLWKDMNSVDELNSLVSSWILTLEKQGCHNLLRAGASGVVQAMVLSLGGFRFSNQHLELNIHPKYLHRDYMYRRINYGNMTHINVSVSVTDDNKAVLYVALDRSNGQYFACDAGCLDDPVPLSQEKKMFPVKLTEPLTAILYIASDKEHIEELHHAIHVKEVVEAPAHEHHVIALHKHGHHLGGLPTLFWISICAVIIVFHVFLCKLIVKEYCEPPDKMRYRYSKP